MSHYIEKCKECDEVIGQCRCMDCNKSVRWSVCHKCSGLCQMCKKRPGKDRTELGINAGFYCDQCWDNMKRCSP